MNFKITKVEYKPNGDRASGKVYINDTTYFDNVPENIWNYFIGCYKVLDKRFKERKKHNYIFKSLCIELSNKSFETADKR